MFLLLYEIEGKQGNMNHRYLQTTHDIFNPVKGYLYEGMTCVDDQRALVIGYWGGTTDSSLQEGIILSTTDGRESSTRYSVPIDDVKLWKTSFGGARR